MAFATREILSCLAEFASRFDETRTTAELATSARRLAANFENLQAKAARAGELDPLSARALGRVYVEIAIRLNEVYELADLAPSNDEAARKAFDRFSWVGDLVVVSEALLPRGSR